MTSALPLSSPSPISPVSLVPRLRQSASARPAAHGDATAGRWRTARLLAQFAGWVLMAFTLAMAVQPVQALPFQALDEKSIRSVVEGQLAALAKDDAAKAFSYAAPNVREAVGSAGRFLSMVQSDYPVVYRPASVAFLKPEGKDDVAIQRVVMVDAQGDSWLAVYSLARQKDRSWRITGCNVVENKGRMA